MARKRTPKIHPYWQSVLDKIVRHEMRTPGYFAPNPYIVRMKALTAHKRRQTKLDKTPTPVGHVRVGVTKDGVLFAPIEHVEFPSPEKIAASVKETERRLIQRGACPECFLMVCSHKHKRVKPKPVKKAKAGKRA